MNIGQLNINLNLHLRQLIVYGIIGVFSSSLDFIIFTMLSSLAGINYLISNVISVVFGITTSFTLNRKFNFKVEDRMPRRFLIFFTVGICGLMASNIILYVCINQLEMQKMISKLISIVIVVGFQFILNKFITFKPAYEE